MEGLKLNQSGKRAVRWLCGIKPMPGGKRERAMPRLYTERTVSINLYLFIFRYQGWNPSVLDH